MTDPDAIEAVVPAVGAVVVRDDRVLVVRDVARAEWMVPFGRLESGESVRETVRREVREETSVAVRVDRLAGVYSHPDTQVLEHRSGRLLQFVTTLVVCSVVGGDGSDSGPEPEPEPEPDGEEVDRARFVSRAALPEMEPVGEWVRDALAGETTLR